MCRTCEYIRTLPLDEALATIAAQLKPPRSRGHEHFKRLLDNLLGTEEAVTNPELDEIWERSNRGSKA